MTEFKTDIAYAKVGNEKVYNYEITFSTDNKDYYEQIQNECRKCIDRKVEIQKTAKEMFKKLGYKIAKEKLVDSCYLAYLNENSVAIGFFKDKRFAKAGDFESDSIITVGELKAINKQVEELGW